MALSLLLALLAPPDPAAVLVHAEARRRRTVVATPIPEGRPPRSGETWTAFAALSDGVLTPIEGGLARGDRPLLISPRSLNGGTALQGLPLLGPVSRAMKGMASADVAKGGYSWPTEGLPAVDRAAVRDALGHGMPAATGDPERDETESLRFTPSLQIAVRMKNGEAGGVYVSSDGRPYDPTAILERLRPKDMDPVPDALRKAVGDRTIPTPGTALSLAEWGRRLATTGVDLKVDARAAAWRVAVGTPGATLRVVEGLRAVARAERLYWRPVGAGWMLAASPGDPRPFAMTMLRATAWENMIPILDRMARSGLVPEDMLALIAAGKQAVKDLSPDDRERIRRLVASGTPWTGYENRLPKAMADPEAVVEPYLSMVVSFNRGDALSNGIAVMLP